MNRRNFVRAGVLTVGSATLNSCVPADRESAEGTASTGPAAATSLDRDAALDLAQSTAEARLAACHHCAQSTFLALKEVFGLPGDDIVRALTPLPGIAERGETCGAVTAALLAMGLVYGRDRITDWEKWRSSLVPARAFCERFADRFGSTACSDVVECQFGERYDLYDAEDLVQFQAGNPTKKCGEVVGFAARTAAEYLFDAARESG